VPPPAAERQRRAPMLVPTAAAVLVLAVGGVLGFLARPAPDAPVTRYLMGFAGPLEPIAERPFALSASGSHLAYIGPAENGTQVWLKARHQHTPVPVRGTADVVRATFSPDGEWLAFVQGTQLRKVAVVGGAAITLADSAAAARGVAWLEDGTLIYAAAPTASRPTGHALRRVSASGGPAKVVWESDSATAWNPAPLPGGRGFLFIRCGGGGTCNELDLWAVDLRDGASLPLMAGAAAAQYLPTGHVLYGRRDGALLAVPFDVRRLRTRGAPVPVRDSVAIGANGTPLFAAASDGTLIVRHGPNLTGSARHELVWVDREGRETAVDPSFVFRLTVQGDNRGWALSPDGSRVAIGLNTDAGDDIWIKQLPSGPVSRITFDSLPEYRPRWLPDGRSLSFISYAGPGRASLQRRSADGTGRTEAAASFSTLGIFEGTWSRDGRWLLLRTGGTVNQVGGRDIMAMRIGHDSVPQPVVASPDFDEAAIALSPDGRWIAYESNETGRTEVYIRPFPDTDAGKWQVSIDGGQAPLWAPNGRELFYVTRARDMISVPVGAGSTPALGGRELLFRLRSDLYLTDLERYTPFDISPDGRRFIMARRVQVEARHFAPLIVTENWFPELRALTRH
jgi:eukaryotic-like serine/threonine-protein kinase